ncbi:MAG TPA: family 20 glycosylhydrolase, partial [Opitutaceae bacterium]|nr:family 20 glycosylhydrolase [Opitutaceae bacterium]
GIRVVPIVNLLGHTQYLIKTPALRDLNELRDHHGRPLEHGQVCPLHPRLAEVAEKLLRDIAPFCTAGLVHAGLDESFQLGRCPRCREEIARAGLAAHFAGHISRLHTLTAALGLRLGLWADMFYYIPEAIARLPRDVVAYEWYYYPFPRRPRVELFNFAEADLATRFRQRGIAFYGCPMNGAFRWEPLPAFGERLGNILSWWRYCRRSGAAGFLVTSWEPSRLAAELPLVVDAAAACLWTNPEIDRPEKMLERGFRRVFGRDGNSAARAALAADKFPFSGYARWQINERWDVFAGEFPAAFAREAQALQRLAKTAGLPPALAASLEFRHTLAQRDRFVRGAAQSVFAARRQLARGKPDRAADALAPCEGATKLFASELRRGLAAARRMWRRSRDPRGRGPNEEMLTRDARRLRAWQRWLRRAKKSPALAAGPTPFCGRWQLQFSLHNFAPALQKVIVEQRHSDGAWRELHGLFTIEFQAAAARPRAKIVREISVPVDSTDAVLRLAVRGVGQVAVSNIVLTDGVATRPARLPRRKVVLGRPAPSAGFPPLDITRNSDELGLSFA